MDFLTHFYVNSYLEAIKSKLKIIQPKYDLVKIMLINAFLAIFTKPIPSKQK